MVGYCSCGVEVGRKADSLLWDEGVVRLQQHISATCLLYSSLIAEV